MISPELAGVALGTLQPQPRASSGMSELRAGWMVGANGHWDFVGTPRHTPEQSDAIADESAALLAFIAMTRGDPKITAWEEDFLASIARIIAAKGAGVLSPKQRDVLGRICDRVYICTHVEDGLAED
jgi:hypothetical protein